MADRAGEVRVDPSSEPGRDEYGLPPADIEIPDDARDLDRDVQAYHRELRALRRRMRMRRLAAPVMRRGLLIPLVAGCLAVTLLSGTLLTMISGHRAGPALPRVPSATANASASPSGHAQPPLPTAQVQVAGKQVGLRSLVPALLAWIPANCNCVRALRQLVKQAGQAHVTIYFVGTARAAQQLPVLAAQTGQRRSQVVNDTTDALGLAYRPSGLTAILANSDSSVGDVVRQLPSGDRRLVAELPSLAPGPVRPSASPGRPSRQAP